MPAITRLTAWKFTKGATDAQKRHARASLLKLYADLAHLVNRAPTGGKDVSKFGLHKDFEFAFTAEFKSAEARDQFDTHPLHNKAVMTDIRPFIADIFVYDLVKNQF